MFKALVDLVMLNPGKALDDFLIAGVCAALSLGVALAAIASPVANAVDLIGSGISTIAQSNESDEQEAHIQGFFPA